MTDQHPTTPLPLTPDEARETVVRAVANEVVALLERGGVAQPTGGSSDTMRKIASEVYDEREPRHILACPIGAKVEKLVAQSNRILGVLLLTRNMIVVAVPIIAVLLGWWLKASADRAEQLQRSVHKIEILMQSQASATWPRNMSEYAQIEDE